MLCYGTVAGGFLSDRWLGAAEPAAGFENRSLIKYKLVIDDFGGWALFQKLLKTLRRIADSHGSDIATVASAAMLRAAGRCRRHRRRAQPLASGIEPRNIEPRAHR